MKKYILGICTLFFLAISCNKTAVEKQNQQTQKETQVATVTEEEDIVEPKTTQKQFSPDVPSYMNIELKGYGSPDTNLANFYGEVIFVNYWGSWCPPCRMEMPSIQSLYDKYNGQVKFVTVAFEKRPGSHIAFIDKTGYTFPVYEVTSPLEPKMKAQGFPTTFIIDKKGKIKAKDVGAADWNAPQVHKLLDKLLAE